MDVTPEMIHQLEAPMPWIGMYSAAASLLCALAMAADAFHGFSTKKYWFPSKYFSLNATSLTLLAVVMKLPLDLTTKMHSVPDRLAKVSSLVFMSTAMANSLTSLGSMDNKNVLMNVAALAILVVTVVGNVGIQVIQMLSYLDGRRAFFEEFLALSSMLLLVVMFISTALMIPSTKRFLDAKYLEMHKSALNEENNLVEMRRASFDELKVLIKKHLVMAETSDPQFVIARSATATTAGVLSKGFILKICILAQCLIVMSSKLVLFVSVAIATPITSCLNRVKKRASKSGKVSDEEENITEMDTSPYVMLLDGEVKLPAETLRIIYKQVDKVIQRGKMQKPKKLLTLLSMSCNFDGVMEFDSPEVPNLAPQDLPYCWALPVVALTCIARALPNVGRKKSDGLVSSVTEGLHFVKLIDKVLDTQGSLGNVRSAAKAMWVDVELGNEWRGKNLDEVSVNGKNAEEILKQFHVKAENVVVEFKREARSCVMKNPLNWPADVIAANAMYRVSRTILMKQWETTDEGLFEQTSILIADILAACFTNMVRIISVMCHSNAIEERGTSVGKAAILLGETEDIILLLQGRELPEMLASGCIEEWMWMNLENEKGCKSMRDDITIKVEG